MAEPTEFQEGDPRHHTAKLKRMLTETMEHARQDVAKIDDPKAQALFETTAEVLAGLKKAYEQYEQHSEGAWKTAKAAKS
jgi:predicted metal-dependent HD superfamily phosphohydrolase